MGLGNGQLFMSPARIFLAQTDVREPAVLLGQYLRFLRDSVGRPRGRVSPSAICRTFGFEVHKAEMPERRRGWSQARLGTIAVNANDSPASQEFTIAHEMVEDLLSWLLEESPGTMHERSDEYWHAAERERLCDKGAIELLMPREEIRGLLKKDTGDLALVRRLSTSYGVSLTAAARRVVDVTEAPVLALWFGFTGNERERWESDEVVWADRSWRSTTAKRRYRTPLGFTRPSTVLSAPYAPGPVHGYDSLRRAEGSEDAEVEALGGTTPDAIWALALIKPVEGE